MKTTMKLFNWPKSVIINNLDDLPKYLNTTKVFIITDSNIYRFGLLNVLLEKLKKSSIDYEVYSNTKSNPTLDSIEQAIIAFKESGSEVLIGIGGGSVLDTTKLVAGGTKNQNLKKMRGYFKVRGHLPFMCLVPTTAGSGSEATLAAVVVDEKTKEKYVIGSLKLIPDIVVLDATLLQNLPSNILAYTGLDALVHALECYIGRANTKETKELSITSIKKIWTNLEKAYTTHELKSLQEMLEASHLAGRAFTRGFVGYVHALSHPISGIYDLPHGLVNAVILPKVLKVYGENIEKDMKQIYYALGYQDIQKSYREFIIKEIEVLNARVGIPKKLKNIKDEDLERMVKAALKEAHPMYPVPRILTKKELLDIYKEII